MTRNELLRAVQAESTLPEPGMRSPLPWISAGRAAEQAEGSGYRERISVRLGGRVRIVEVDRIDYLEAQGNYVRLHAGGSSFLVRESLANLESDLDPRLFLRIHRSRIVRLDRVAELVPLVRGEYRIRLQSGAEVRSSRRYRPQINAALGVQ